MWFFEGDTDEILPAASRTFEFGGALPSDVTLQRDAVALGRNSSGRWVTVAANLPRTWYHPVTLDGPYTLIEPQRTQLVFRTRQPTFTSVQATLVQDSAVQTPFGLGAVRITPNTADAFHGWDCVFGNTNHAAALPDAVNVAVTAVLKPTGAYTIIGFFLTAKSGAIASARFLLEGSGVVVSSSGLVGASISRDTDGFYSLTAINAYGIGTTAPAVQMNVYDPAGNRAFSGDGSSGFWMAYAGAEVGSEATSPVLNTGTSSVIRPADTLTASVGWITPGDKTFGIDYIPYASGSATVLHLSGADSIQIDNDASSVIYSVTTGGTVSTNLSGPAPLPMSARTVVFTNATNGFLLSQDGAMLGSDGAGTAASAFTALRIGGRTDGSRPMPMLLRRLKFWNTALALPAIQSYSEDLSQPGVAAIIPAATVQSALTVPPALTTVSLLVVLLGKPTGGTVTYRTIDGTALASRDYVGAQGTVTFAVGQSSAVITVGLLARSAISDRTFRVEIQAGAGVTVSNGTCDVLLLRTETAGSDTSTRLILTTALPGELSLTRSSTGWARNALGMWTAVPANGFRQHYTAPGVSGLLVEAEAGEQRLFNSFDPGWIPTGGILTLSTAVAAIAVREFSDDFSSEYAAPEQVREFSDDFSFEYTTADFQTADVDATTPSGTSYLRFRETATTTEHRASVTLTSANCDIPVGALTVSAIVRPVSRRWLRLSFRGVDNIIRAAHFDLTGAGTVLAADSGVTATVESEPIMVGWYRVALSRAQAVTANVAPQIIMTVEDALQSTSLVGDPGNGFDLCHVQVEPGAGMSSPILVSGAVARTHRAADILTASGTWYQNASYTLGMRFIRLRDTPATQRIWMAKDGAGGVNGVFSAGDVLTADDASLIPIASFAFVGTGTQTAWTLPLAAGDLPVSAMVAVDGVVQPASGVTLGATQLSLTEAPPVGSSVEIRIFGGSMQALDYTATGTQTTWTLPFSVVGGSSALIVAVDGVLQSTSTYSVVGSQLTFTQQPPPRAAIDIRRIGS
jgi:hypothetical protein